MGKLSDHLITEETYASIKEVKIHLGDDEFIVGIKDRKNVTWRDYKSISMEYFDMSDIDRDDLESGSLDIKDNLRLDEGDTARYLHFIKYIKCKEEGMQNFTLKLLTSLPLEFLEQIEAHIPSMEEVIGSIKPGFKKKSKKLLEKIKAKHRSKSKTKN